MNYYSKNQLIAAVDKNDTILHPIDKWQAHKDAILHRGFTIVIEYENNLILQHRKHPVFDRVFDITVSSHQIYKENVLQDDIEAIYETLEREGNIKKSDLLKEPSFLGNIYYKAKDPNSIYTEHEFYHFYRCQIKKLLLPNFDFTYGFTLVKKTDITDKKNPIYPLLAPWIKQAISDGLL